MEIKTYDPGKGRRVYVGEIRNGVFYRIVQPHHYMKKYEGYGLQDDVVGQLRVEGVDKVCLVEAATSTSWLSLLEHWYSPVAILAEWGHGWQYFLPVDQMMKLKRSA